MNSYLEPLRQELERRARLSQEIYRHLEACLKARDENAGVLEGEIDAYWSFMVESCQNGASVYPVVTTEHGVPLQNPIAFCLFRKEWMNDEPGINVVPVLDIYVAENGAVRDGALIAGPPGDEEPFLAATYVELNSRELEGFKQDVERLLGMD